MAILAGYTDIRRIAKGPNGREFSLCGHAVTDTVQHMHFRCEVMKDASENIMGHDEDGKNELQNLIKWVKD